MISIKQKGNFNNIEKFFKKTKKQNFRDSLKAYGEIGVAALAMATPAKTGKTASSWSYEIQETRGSVKIYWTNSNINKGVNIAVIIQYGHGTRNGGYVVGRDYINPAMGPVFDSIADGIWKEVSSS